MSALVIAVAVLCFTAIVSFVCGALAAVAFLAWHADRILKFRRVRKPACLACGAEAGQACGRLVCERYTDEHAAVDYSMRLH